MIIYSITTALEESVENKWVTFTKTTILPTIMDTGLIEDYRFIRVIPSPGVDISYNLQLRCKNHGALNQFMSIYEQKLHEQEHKEFEGKIAKFQNVLEQVAEGSLNG